MPFLEREQRVVGADADVGARAHRGAALADQDVAGEHALAAELLHAQTLAVRIAAVTSTAACLFMCHVSAPTTSALSADAGDLDLRVLLAMRALAQVVLAATELHDDLLLALAVLLDDGLDLAALEQRRADLDVVAVTEEQHFAELDGRARLSVEFLDLEDGALFDPILFAARGDDRVHRDCSEKTVRDQSLKAVCHPEGTRILRRRPRTGQTAASTPINPVESMP